MPCSVPHRECPEGAVGNGGAVRSATVPLNCSARRRPIRRNAPHPRRGQSHQRPPPALHRANSSQHNGLRTVSPLEVFLQQHSTQSKTSGICPLFDSHNRPLPNLRFNLKFIHEPSNARQTQTKTSRRAVTILECLTNVGDSRSLVARDHDDALSVRRTHQPHNDLTLSGVHDDIARQFGNGGSDQGEIGRRESELGSLGAPGLPRSDDIQVGRYRDACFGSVALGLVPWTQTRTDGGAHRLEILAHATTFSAYSLCQENGVLLRLP